MQSILQFMNWSLMVEPQIKVASHGGMKKKVIRLSNWSQTGLAFSCIFHFVLELFCVFFSVSYYFLPRKKDVLKPWWQSQEKADEESGYQRARPTSLFRNYLASTIELFSQEILMSIWLNIYQGRKSRNLNMINDRIICLDRNWWRREGSDGNMKVLPLRTAQTNLAHVHEIYGPPTPRLAFIHDI